MITKQKIYEKLKGSLPPDTAKELADIFFSIYEEMRGELEEARGKGEIVEPLNDAQKKSE